MSPVRLEDDDGSLANKLCGGGVGKAVADLSRSLNGITPSCSGRYGDRGVKNGEIFYLFICLFALVLFFSSPGSVLPSSSSSSKCKAVRFVTSSEFLSLRVAAVAFQEE